MLFIPWTLCITLFTSSGTSGLWLQLKTLMNFPYPVLCEQPFVLTNYRSDCTTGHVLFRNWIFPECSLISYWKWLKRGRRYLDRYESWGKFCSVGCIVKFGRRWTFMFADISETIVWSPAYVAFVASGAVFEALETWRSTEQNSPYGKQVPSFSVKQE